MMKINESKETGRYGTVLFYFLFFSSVSGWGDGLRRVPTLIGLKLQRSLFFPGVTALGVLGWGRLCLLCQAGKIQLILGESPGLCLRPWWAAHLSPLCVLAKGVGMLTVLPSLTPVCSAVRSLPSAGHWHCPLQRYELSNSSTQNAFLMLRSLRPHSFVLQVSHHLLGRKPAFIECLLYVVGTGAEMKQNKSPFLWNLPFSRVETTKKTISK